MINSPTSKIFLRCTPEFKAQVDEYSRSLGMDTSNYIRFVVSQDMRYNGRAIAQVLNTYETDKTEA